MSAHFEKGADRIRPDIRSHKAPPLGVGRVLSQVRQDLFGTKDVQDAITASYVWLEDQAGHIALGFVFTLLPCSIANVILSETSPWRDPVFLGIATLACLIGVLKEGFDKKDSKQRWGHVFRFDSRDIDWNIWTAVFYYLVGIGLALSPFLWGWRGPIVVLIIALYPILAVAYWWLQRKLAFQQTGLPYLFRLANFNGVLEPPSIDLVSKLANFRNKRVTLWTVLFGVARCDQRSPEARHILITGDLGAGKTSLSVGIGTEFSFSLRRCRYLSVVKLVELVLGKDNKGSATRAPGEVESVDGRYLWMLPNCDLVIVDDVDVGVRVGEVGSHLIHPEALAETLTLNAGSGRSPLAWLGDRRSVWVIGDASQESAWRSAIARLLVIHAREIATVHIGSSPSPTPNQPAIA